MDTQYAQASFSAVGEFLRNIIAQVAVMATAPSLVPVPAAAGRLAASGATRRSPAIRPINWLPLLVGFVLLVTVPAWAGKEVLPAGVPNIFDSQVQEQFQPVGVANLGGNSDFPAVLLANLTDEQPQAILVGLDARNGKDTWSLTDDPIILIVVFSDPATIKALYLDSGIVKQGKESGEYTELDGVDAGKLPDLLKVVTDSLAQTYM